jgi:anti-sigma factor RsiW
MSVNHEEWANLYLDDALPADERARYEAHLPACADCQRLVRESRALFAALEQMPIYAPPADFSERVLKRATAPLPRLVVIVLSAQVIAGVIVFVAKLPALLRWAGEAQSTGAQTLTTALQSLTRRFANAPKPTAESVSALVHDAAPALTNPGFKLPENTVTNLGWAGVILILIWYFVQRKALAQKSARSR